MRDGRGWGNYRVSLKPSPVARCCYATPVMTLGN